MSFYNFLEKHSNNNASQATIRLLRKLKVRVTASTVINQVEKHPDFPSLNSICDSLKIWNVENLAVKVEGNRLSALPTPFIAHKKSGGGCFVVVHSVNGAVRYLDEWGVNRKVVLQEFIKDWSGVVLLAEKGERSGERNYAAQRRIELLSSLRFPFIGLGFMALLFLFNLLSSAPLISTVLLTVKLLGILVTALLLLFEIDRSDPLLHQVCSTGGKTNCNAILTGKGAKVFSWLSWSEVGFFYFTGGFLFLLFTANEYQSSFVLLCWLNLVALPYTLFSVVYQWRFAKQWCPLCLVVQGLLWVEAIIGFWWYWNRPGNPVFHVAVFQPLLASFLLPVFFWMAAKRGYLDAQTGRAATKEAAKLKYDKDIFHSLLQKQKQITSSADQLGITLGNPDARHTIIKVCNPYCGPCANVHPVLEEILKENSSVKVQILFTATNEEHDKRAKPVKHFMAIQAKGDNALMQKALDDWYGTEQKDYEAFAKKYPMAEDLQEQSGKVTAMRQWCTETGITFTPTIFINGYQLPKGYSLADLRYFLAV